MFLLPSDFWQVDQTKKKGRGVFARKEIAPGAVIGDYLGTIIHPDDDDDSKGIYGMHAHDDFVIMPDVSSIDIHCINHSCMPNCGIYPFKNHILYIAIRKIFPGEELTVSYVVSPELTGPQYPCRCEMPLCRGSMVVSEEKAHTFWEVFVKEGMGEYFNKIDVPYGAIFPRLSSYPDSVSVPPIYDTL